MLEEYGLKRTGLDRVIAASSSLLGLITYYTSGPTGKTTRISRFRFLKIFILESRAWSIPQGYTAAQAAGVIHTDFEKGFIKAEVTSFNVRTWHIKLVCPLITEEQDYVDAGGEDAAKAKGKTRIEGKDYIVDDGDVMLFRFH